MEAFSKMIMETLLEIRINAFPNELEVESEWSGRSTDKIIETVFSKQLNKINAPNSRYMWLINRNKLPKMGNKNIRRTEVMNACRVISEHVRELSATKFPAEPKVRVLI